MKRRLALIAAAATLALARARGARPDEGAQVRVLAEGRAGRRRLVGVRHQGLRGEPSRGQDRMDQGGTRCLRGHDDHPLRRRHAAGHRASRLLRVPEVRGYRLAPAAGSLHQGIEARPERMGGTGHLRVEGRDRLHHDALFRVLHGLQRRHPEEGGDRGSQDLCGFPGGRPQDHEGRQRRRHRRPVRDGP